MTQIFSYINDMCIVFFGDQFANKLLKQIIKIRIRSD